MGSAERICLRICAKHMLRSYPLRSHWELLLYSFIHSFIHSHYAHKRTKWEREREKVKQFANIPVNRVHFPKLHFVVLGHSSIHHLREFKCDEVLWAISKTSQLCHFWIRYHLHLPHREPLFVWHSLVAIRNEILWDWWRFLSVKPKVSSSRNHPPIYKTHKK